MQDSSIPPISRTDLQSLAEQIDLVKRYLVAMRADLDTRKKMAPEARVRLEWETATMARILETLERLQPPF